MSELYWLIDYTTSDVIFQLKYDMSTNLRVAEFQARDQIWEMRRNNVTDVFRDKSDVAPPQIVFTGKHIVAFGLFTPLLSNDFVDPCWPLLFPKGQGRNSDSWP